MPGLLLQKNHRATPNSDRVWEVVSGRILTCVTHTGLGIDAFARTREALVNELNEQIGMLWQEYALAQDDALDKIAIKMKQALLIAFSEVAHGA